MPSFKPSARFRPTMPRNWTVSVAVPTSIIAEYVSRSPNFLHDCLLTIDTAV